MGDVEDPGTTVTLARTRARHCVEDARLHASISPAVEAKTPKLGPHDVPIIGPRLHNDAPTLRGALYVAAQLPLSSEHFQIHLQKSTTFL